MKHTEGTFQASGGLELYYQRWKPDGEQRAVLAVTHGFGEHSGRYMNLVNFLVPRGIAVYAYDLRGHGRSPGKRGHVSRWGEFREDLRYFLRWVGQEEQGQPVFLWGHSLGGLIVLDYVLRDPGALRGVIASAPVLAQVGVSPFLLTMSKILSRWMPRFTMATNLDTSALSRDPSVVTAYEQDPLVHGEGTARLGAEMNTALEWAQAHSAELRIPVLIVHGDADRLIGIGGSKTFFSNVASDDKEMLIYEGGYHESHNDIEHERVLTDVESWLSRHL